MHYFDTSFIVPFTLPESTSPEVERLITGLPAGGLTISHWTRVEFSSMLAREVRMGGMDARAAQGADAHFEAIMAESFDVLLPGIEDFELAKQYLGNYKTGLRAGDALHLAIAKNHRAKAIYSLDKALIKAGKMLGLPVSSGVRMAR